MPLSVEEFQSVGFYAPLTSQGTVIANKFLCSCYANYPNHDLAHIVMKPVILKENLLGSEKKTQGYHQNEYL